MIPATNNIFLCLLTFLWPGTSTAQVVTADEGVEKQPSTIKESVGQHQMESGSKRAKKLSKRRILESEAECGISAFLLLFSPQNAIHWRQKEVLVLAYLHKFYSFHILFTTRNINFK